MRERSFSRRGLPWLPTIQPFVASPPRKAAQSRWNKPTPETASALAEAQLANYIGRVVDRAPELTDEQRSRLALLLRDPQGVGQQESGRLTAHWLPDAERSRVKSAQQAMECEL